MSKLVIKGLSFDLSGGVTIDYMDMVSDVKTNHLAVSHAIRIPSAPEYEAGLEELADVVRRVLLDAIEDLSIVESVSD